jgi:hypothetical protein
MNVLSPVLVIGVLLKNVEAFAIVPSAVVANMRGNGWPLRKARTASAFPLTHNRLRSFPQPVGTRAITGLRASFDGMGGQYYI